MEYKRVNDDGKMLEVNKLAREGWLLKESLLSDNQLVHIMERAIKQIL